jgi:hypothetical protein
VAEQHHADRVVVVARRHTTAEVRHQFHRISVGGDARCGVVPGADPVSTHGRRERLDGGTTKQGPDLRSVSLENIERTGFRELTEMSWETFRARRAVLDDVLTRAQVDIDSALRFDEIPRAMELFGSGDNVLLTLQRQWTTHLAVRLDQALEDGTSLDTACVRLADEMPAVRAVLDAGTHTSPTLRTVRRGEIAMIEAHKALERATPRTHRSRRRRRRTAAVRASIPSMSTASLWAGHYAWR